MLIWYNIEYNRNVCIYKSVSSSFLIRKHRMIDDCENWALIPRINKQKFFRIRIDKLTE